jgi:hypothetical protein
MKLCGVLKGDSGFITPDIHLNSDYGLQNKRQVFTVDKEDMTLWHRRDLPLSKKVKVNEKVIRCEHPYCNRFAASLPHSWPYLNGAKCDKHQDWNPDD